MTSMFTLLSFAAKLGAIEADLKLAGQGIIAEYALKVRQNAMDAIGTYHYGWSPLGPEAVARHGDTPLLHTSKLGDSSRHADDLDREISNISHSLMLTFKKVAQDLPVRGGST
jgi:hypothetical protein